MNTPSITENLSLESLGVLHSNELLEQELSVNNAFVESSNPNKKRRRASKSGNCQGNNIDEQNCDCNLKKSAHRDIERQRRKEMATLYATLRSLLPTEYITGKRSTSDHMHEAVKYIKYMERNIEELRMRKDKLKKLYKSNGSFQNGSSNSVNFPKCVTVNYCLGGVEIIISCGLKKKDGFPLSRVLVELIEIGHDIVSCISSKANDRIIYRIQSQVNDWITCIDLSELQQRLANMVDFN
ncbi:hypothetical protein CDL12_06875 [Handroanthus impetiginosus]|uniref:BHLH domain-containing protein n=1 Tax=Handroanthus impetiginosus TaxID=429701 RepID=A0A2G9HSD6_9LAMI|nr:hypothetical protein CDL12_06875 [Handroanthus impetiginosus]